MNMNKKIKGWAVVCSNPKEFNNAVFAFVQKESAREKRRQLNKEFSGYCIHRISPCEIIIKTPSE